MHKIWYQTYSKLRNIDINSVRDGAAFKRYLKVYVWPVVNAFLETFLRDCLICHNTTLCTSAVPKNMLRYWSYCVKYSRFPFQDQPRFLLHNQQPLQSLLPLPTAWALNLNPSSCVSGSSCPGVLADTSFFLPKCRLDLRQAAPGP